VEETVVPGALDCAVPPLLLQPLVENAVAHGISNLTEGGWIRVRVSRDGQQDSDDLPAEDLRIEVENNFDPEMPRRRGHGVGLSNVRQRLATRYGDRARFEVRAEGERFHVSIVLPAEKVETVA
jgi:LytS/YehU family sensor histidine kinase